VALVFEVIEIFLELGEWEVNDKTVSKVVSRNSVLLINI
jgi:hypothetical protein